MTDSSDKYILVECPHCDLYIQILILFLILLKVCAFLTRYNIFEITLALYKNKWSKITSFTITCMRERRHVHYATLRVNSHIV